MGINFPSAPAIGEIFPTPAQPGMPQWTWTGTEWTSNNNNTAFYVLRTGDQMTGDLKPSVNGGANLGSATLRWGTVYTSDLDLNNGIGDWTIVEGEDDLFLYNNKKKRVYKFTLTEVDLSMATPKRNG